MNIPTSLKPGITITISGPRACGKTMLSLYLKNTLEKVGYTVSHDLGMEDKLSITSTANVKKGAKP